MTQTDSSVQGKVRKYARWSKLLPQASQRAQIRLEVQPGPAAVHNGVLHQGFKQKYPMDQDYGCEEQLP